MLTTWRIVIGTVVLLRGFGGMAGAALAEPRHNLIAEKQVNYALKQLAHPDAEERLTNWGQVLNRASWFIYLLGTHRIRNI